MASLQLRQYGHFGTKNSIIGINVMCFQFQNYNNTLITTPRVFSISHQHSVYPVDWNECETGSFVCGIRTKLNFKSNVIGVELKCCYKF